MITRKFAFIVPYKWDVGKAVPKQKAKKEIYNTCNKKNNDYKKQLKLSNTLLALSLLIEAKYESKNFSTNSKYVLVKSKMVNGTMETFCHRGFIWMVTIAFHPHVKKWEWHNLISQKLCLKGEKELTRQNRPI